MPDDPRRPEPSDRRAASADDGLPPTSVLRPSRAVRHSTAMAAPPIRRTRAEPLRDLAPLALPEATRPALAAAIADAAGAVDDGAFADGVASIAAEVELALRQGRAHDVLDGSTALLALESRLVGSPEQEGRLRDLAQVVRRLASPRLLREVARLRVERAGDVTAAALLQRLLLRFGVDGAEALVEECIVASTPAIRAVAETALRAHRRAHDALEDLARDPRDLTVREAAALLATLGDERAEAILSSMRAHPDARARAATVTALGRIQTVTAVDAAMAGLADRAPLVRARAIAVLVSRRVAEIAIHLAPLLDAEPDTDVLYAAVDALGAVSTPEGVQALIRLAKGEGRHPLAASAALRVQACRALIIARAPVGMLAVQALREDPDREVRDAAVHLVASAKRRTTTSGIPIIRE